MIAIINARLETISNGVIEKGQMLVEDGKITAIGTAVNIPSDAKVYDAKGRTVTPGVIEAHSHAGISEQGLGWEGRDTNEATSPVTAWCNAKDGINMLADDFNDFRGAGITTTGVLPGSANIIGGIAVAVKCKGAIVDDAIVKEAVGMKAALGENPKRLYGGKGKSPSTRMGNAAVMREALLKAQQYLRKLEAAETEKDKPKHDKNSEALLPVVRKEIPLLIHCHRADDIATAIRICNELDVRFTLEHVTDGHLVTDLIKKQAGLSCAVGPTMKYGSKVENKDRDYRTPIVFAREGVPFCFTTDHSVIAGHHLITTAGIAVGWGMERDKALAAITLAGAKHLGLEDRLGSLEVGKDADFVIWSGDPLDFTTFADVTFIDGEIVYEREV